MNEKNIEIQPASSDDMPFIKECIGKFRLDDEDLDYRQFVVAVDRDETIAFIKKPKSFDIDKFNSK